MRRRVFLLVLDSLGIGGAPDAKTYGDEGANTLGHIAAHLQDDIPLHLPNLASLGLGLAVHGATGANPLGPVTKIIGQWGWAHELSRGKDTPSGHWEIAGVPVMFDWGYFPKTLPTFPHSLTDNIIKAARLPGILGNKHASGTEIIEELGEEHLKTGKPIFYTSADSVIQIAAHTQAFGLARLYDVCEITRTLSKPLNIGRVIARPFTGSHPQNFKRTPDRKDYTLPPPSPTLLDGLTKAGREVITIGKIGDIYAHSGTGREIKAASNQQVYEATRAEISGLADGGFLMSNFVDMDMLFGHRRDVKGYANSLAQFDTWLPALFAELKKGDRLIITADHGNDPTWPGTDHTREAVPILCYGPDLAPATIGCRRSFADIGQTIARYLDIPCLSAGKSWLI